MAYIQRDPRWPQGVWYAAYRYTDGRRAFRSTRRKNRREAQAIADAWEQAEREAATGDLAKDRVAEILNETLKRIGVSPIERISIKGWLEDWLAAKEVSAKAVSVKAYAVAINEFLRFLGPSASQRRLESISETDIEGFVAHLVESGRSAVTVNKLARKYLSSPFEKARRTGKIKYNPVHGTAPLKTEAKTTKETFSAAQVIALLEVAPNDWQGAILFAYGSGARLGDVANLRWSSLDLENDIVVFTEQKTDAKATIGLHPDFTEWLQRQPSPINRELPVFPTLAGQPLAGDSGLSKAFTKLIDAAGIEKRLIRSGNDGKGRSVRALTFHSFRHTAASNVFAQASLKEITRRVTNHAVSGVVDRYIHEDLEAIRAAVALIPRLPKKIV
jgi:integrase